MIQEELFKLQDPEYRDFQAKLIPTIDPSCVIGVRTPELKTLAKKLAGLEETSEFLHDLPHRYFDENQLHAFIISEIKDFDLCTEEVDRFLPFVDNWATCDQMSPKAYKNKKNRARLLDQIKKWIRDDKTYTVRFAVKMLMSHYLDEDFDISYPEAVSRIRSEEYYINMMTAWYFATALAKQYDAILPFIENRSLDTWTHNRAIQKAVESNRITPSQKEYLKSLKVK